jgi:hypothetical protein
MSSAAPSHGAPTPRDTRVSRVQGDLRLCSRIELVAEIGGGHAARWKALWSEEARRL